MKKKFKKIAVLTFLFFVFGCEYHGDDVTIYTADCVGPIENKVCNGKLILRTPMTYRANFNKQEIIWWVGDGSPGRMSNCAIKDAQNWKCDYKSFGSPVSATMQNGKIQYLFNGMDDNGFVQMSWSWYWYYKIFGKEGW